MRIGAMLKREVPPKALIAHAQAHQEVFDELWIVEDLPYAGGIAQAAAVLANTDTVRVGHGIAPAPFRNPAALAMEWATLAEMFPGRFHAGLGHGVQSWMGEIGAKAESPLSLLRETHGAVESLLVGESVSVQGRYVTLDDVRLEFPPDSPPRLSLGVTGPRSLELSGEISRGTILSEGHGPRELAEVRRHIETGVARSGRSVDDHCLTVFTAFHIGGPDTMAPRNPEAPTMWEAIGETPTAVATALQSLIDVGVDSVVLVALGSDIDAQLELVGTEVLPSLRR